MQSTLCFGHDGKQRIAYLESNADILSFAEWDGTQWIKENLDETNMVGWVSFAMDPAGIPFVCYMEHPSGHLKLARRHDGVWDYQFADQSESLGTPLDAEVSRQGVLAIAYMDSDAHILKVAELR